MTPKTVLAAGFEEIRAIEVRCQRCAGKATIPISRRHLPSDFACPGCGQSFWGAEDSVAFNRVKDLIEALAALTELDEHRKFSLGFELDSPA